MNEEERERYAAWLVEVSQQAEAWGDVFYRNGTVNHEGHVYYLYQSALRAHYDLTGEIPPRATKTEVEA